MSRFLPLVLLLALVGCHRQSELGGYSEVGNGGDYIQLLFEQGRLLAGTILDRVQPRSFPESVEAGDREWLVTRKPNLRRDLEPRQTRFLWVKELPAGCPEETCACAPSPGRIFFARDLCERKIQTVRQAAFLILHETMHHFVGNREDQARGLGAALAAAWMNMGHPESPHWRITRAPEGFAPSRPVTEGRSWSVWTGRELLVWNEHRLARFHPENETWAIDDSRNALAEVLPHGSSPLVSGWIGGKLWCLLQPDGKVVSYDPDKHLWEKAERDASELLPLRGSSSQAVSGGSLFLWPGEWLSAFFPEYRVPSPAKDTPLFDGRPARFRDARWTLLETAGAPSSRTSPVLLAAGEDLLVWGGFSVMSPLGDGAVYHAGERKWQPIAKRGAPSPRFGPAAVWTGREMLVYGGSNTWVGTGQAMALDFLPDPRRNGAAYDPVTDRWRPIKSGPEVWPQGESVAAWTGLEMIVKGERRLELYNPFLDRWDETADLSFPGNFPARDVFWTGTELIFWDGSTHTAYLFYR